MPDPAADPGIRLIEDEALAAAVATLSPRDRQVLLLAAWEGLDGVALGRALDLSRGGAAAALSRARSRFREALGRADRADGERGGARP
ncbi:sigma factor-like helix-turn-helix DNA-binding protein [Pseudactinotalea sp. HY158]|uniref:sigma factor-like helix-turn-helix DNA-binding protein n=1 Tax=Pseudactinotalea sp. HY158 TaxID=2654547 RepID=UPI001E4540D4|nr:sigma factor-like helix-turn-helix DNA-binding protein [Pseudactinotalea sp. HY158]